MLVFVLFQTLTHPRDRERDVGGSDNHTHHENENVALGRPEAEIAHTGREGHLSSSYHLGGGSGPTHEVDHHLGGGSAVAEMPLPVSNRIAALAKK